jgi:hypothetical protein
MTFNEVMLNVSKDHHESNQVKVSKSIDMFSIATLVTISSFKTSVQMPKPHNVNKMLEPQCGEVHHQFHFP